MWKSTRTTAPSSRARRAGCGCGRWFARQTGVLMYDEMVLTDLRDAGAEVDLVPCGALSPRLLSP
ncbi:Suppressor of fused-like domain-containing protein OS=Streptomyces antimycoticus OX=68175 GN=SANT12839_061860 PE=4 SV=1 [Streptomyces antimycoticus]